MKKIMILFLLFIVGCKVNRYLPVPKTIEVCNNKTIVTFENKKGKYVIIDTNGYRVNVVKF